MALIRILMRVRNRRLIKRNDSGQLHNLHLKEILVHQRSDYFSTTTITAGLVCHFNEPRLSLNPYEESLSFTITSCFLLKSRLINYNLTDWKWALILSERMGAKVSTKVSTEAIHTKVSIEAS